MKSEFIKDLLSIVLALLVSSILADFLLKGIHDIQLYAWRGLGFTLTALPVISYIRHTHLRKGPLTLALWAIFFVIGTFNILIEAYLFNVTTGAETLWGMLQGFLSVTPAILAIGLFLVNSSTVSTFKRKKYSILSYSWRIITGNVIYFIFYAVAGFTLQAAYPGLMEFYEGKIPPISLIIQTNLFFRGFVFVAIGILIAETTFLNKWKTGILIGAFFSILGGIAPLLSPNELMPVNIRLAHGFEVGISNFLYGVVLGLLLTRPEAKQVT